MYKEDVIYIYIYAHIHTICIMAKLLSHKKKKNEILPFAAVLMDLEGITLSEISNTEKDKKHLFHLYIKST